MSEAAGVVGRTLDLGDAEAEQGRRGSQIRVVGEPARRQWADSHGFLVLFVGIQLAWLAVFCYGALLLLGAVW